MAKAPRQRSAGARAARPCRESLIGRGEGGQGAPRSRRPWPCWRPPARPEVRVRHPPARARLEPAPRLVRRAQRAFDRRRALRDVRGRRRRSKPPLGLVGQRPSSEDADLREWRSMGRAGPRASTFASLRCAAATHGGPSGARACLCDREEAAHQQDRWPQRRRPDRRRASSTYAGQSVASSRQRLPSMRARADCASCRRCLRARRRARPWRLFTRSTQASDARGAELNETARG